MKDVLPIDYVHIKIDVDLDFVFVRILTKLFLTSNTIDFWKDLKGQNNLQHEKFFSSGFRESLATVLVSLNQWGLLLH